MHLSIDNSYSSAMFSARHRWWKQFAKSYQSPRNIAIEARQAAKKASEANEKAAQVVANYTKEQKSTQDLSKQIS